MQRIVLVIVLLTLIAALLVGVMMVQQPRASAGGAQRVEGGGSSAADDSAPPAPAGPELPPLSIATLAAAGELELIRARVEAGGEDLNALDEKYEMSALHHAANLGRADIAALLLEAGANPSIRNGDQLTPLLIAARTGQAEVARLLLERGAEPDARGTNYGFAPLHVAVTSNNLEIVRVLLEHGADPNVEDPDGIRPIDIAENEDHPEIAALLRAQGGASQQQPQQKRQ